MHDDGPASDPRPASSIHLVPGPERHDEVTELVAAVTSAGGERVGVSGVLADLDRRAPVVRVPAVAARWGFRWADDDVETRRWYPQGITSTADRDVSEEYDGRRVLCTSWYSKAVDGLHEGSRVTFVDITDRADVRYRHVLLVEPFRHDDGRVDVRPVKVHAGGLVWHGDYLHVAGTARGIYTFRLADLLRVPVEMETGDARALRLGRGGEAPGSFGYRYLLPVRFTYEAFAEPGHERMRYSFLSLDRGDPPQLVAGEYGRGGRTTRLVTYDLDPETSLLRVDTDGVARPVGLHQQGRQGMQGAVVVRGRWYVTTSAGPLPGVLYVGTPGSFRSRGPVLPIGVEDVSYWPSEDALWSLSEHPGRRWVFSMRRRASWWMAPFAWWSRLVGRLRRRRSG